MWTALEFLLYSPDSYGLGHIRRSISIAGQLLDEFQDSQASVITGSPFAHYFEYPSRCGYVQLPQVTKNACGQYVSGKPNIPLQQTVDLRESLIGQVAAGFKGGAMYVDHSPLGLCGEMTQALCRLTRDTPKTYRVLGMRDVIDESDAVRTIWEKQQVMRVLRCCYDLILVYGQQELYDPIEQYNIPDDVAAKIKFVGYIPRHARKTGWKTLNKRLAPQTGRLVVVTLGGGGDGDLILESFLEGYRKAGPQPGFEVAAVTGPQMSYARRVRFRELSRDIPGLTLIEYTQELPDLLEAADFVVSMGGYNTVCELACAGARSLIIPRCFPRKEQLVRAKLLARLGVASYLTPEQATPTSLIEYVQAGLERPWPKRGWGLEFTGLTRSAEAIRQLMRERTPLQALPCHVQPRKKLRNEDEVEIFQNI